LVLLTKYHSGYQIKKNEIGGACGTYGERIGVQSVLVRKPEERRALGRHRRVWNDNNKMDFHEVECEDMDWIEVAQDRDRWQAVVNEVMNLRVQ
jgi:hypothetical protein